MRNLPPITAVLTVILTASCPLASAAPVGTTHVLLVIDTNAHNAVPLGIPQDGVRMLGLLNSLPPDMRKSINVKVLAGNAVTPDAIRAYYKTLKTEPLDALIFYYSGHGITPGRPPKDILVAPRERPGGIIDYGDMPYLDPTKHRFTTSGGDIDRMEIHRILEQKASRLNVIIGDCCAGFSQTGKTRSDKEGYRADQLREAADGKAVEKDLEIGPLGRVDPAGWDRLIHQHIGVVHVAATPIGINARGDKKYGGHLTFALCRVLSIDENDYSSAKESDYNWPIFVDHRVQKLHKDTFPRPRNPEPKDFAFGLISDMGPTTLGRAHDHCGFASRTFYDEPSKMLFGYGGEGGFSCRVMPGSPTKLAPGFITVGKVENVMLTYLNAAKEFERLEKNRRLQFTILRADITGKTEEVIQEIRLR